MTFSRRAASEMIKRVERIARNCDDRCYVENPTFSNFSFFYARPRPQYSSCCAEAFPAFSNHPI